MKKLLLSASAALLAVSSFAATTDGNTYEPVNGVACQSVWMLSRYVDSKNDVKDYANLPIATSMARTATLYDGVVYVGDSGDTRAEGESTVNQGSIYKYSATDGSFLGKLELVCDGARLEGVRPANQVGVDNFGNLWVIGLTQRSEAAADTKVKVYLVDKETGACTLEGELDFLTPTTRMDYFDLVGDVTRTEAKCVVMSAAAPPTQDLLVFRWVCEQGASEWEGGFDGDTELVMAEAYPSEALAWNYAPTVTIVLGEDEEMYSGALFYVDGFNTCPSMYNTTGSMDDSFANAPDLAPQLGTNGVAELQFGGKNYIAYSIAQYNDGNKCQINVCELGDGMIFEGMQKYWTLPADGLGETSDGGNRVHSISRQYVTENGENVGAYLLTFKSCNGMGIYALGNTGSVEGSFTDDNNAKITVNGDVINVSEEASEIAIFNIAGQEVAKVKNATEIAAPSTGVYIVKAVVNGSPVVTKIVR